MSETVSGSDPNVQKFISTLTGIDPKATVEEKKTQIHKALDTLVTMTKGERDQLEKELTQLIDNPLYVPPPKPRADLSDTTAAINTNPALRFPSFIGSFAAIIREILREQAKIGYTEAIRGADITRATNVSNVSGAALQKQITMTQANEKLVQAIASFVSAGVSIISFMDTAKSAGKAQKEVEEQIDLASKQAPKSKVQAEALEDPHAFLAGDKPGVVTSKTKLDKALDDPEFKTKWDKAQDNLDMMEKLKTETKAKAKADEKNLDELLQNKVRKVDDRERTLNQLVHMKGEAMKSLVQAVSGVMTASITMDRAVLEEIKGINDAMIQTLNKYSETTMKQHDAAAEQFNSWIAFMKEIIQSTISAHKLGRT